MIGTTRVASHKGNLPLMIVAPHGYKNNDENTDVITETIRQELNCHAVINYGWERSDSVDYLKDKADCNNVFHCHEDVVKEEFLEPILNYHKNYREKFIFYIHGMSDSHRLKVADDMDIVVGFGAGTPNSFSCEPWRKDYLCYKLSKKFNVYEGRKGGNMSGWSRNNMNQLFRKHYYDLNTHSFQIEITHSLRSSEKSAIETGKKIAESIVDMSNTNGFKTSISFNSY